MPSKRLSRPQLHNCGRDRCYLSRPQKCGREKHTFLRRGIPRPPISGREKPNIVVVKDLISSSARKETKGGQGSRAWKQSSRKAQEPRANTRPEAQINHKPKVKTSTGPRGLETNDRGPNKGWVPKLV